MPFVKIGSLSALPPGSVMEAHVGGHTYAVCNVGGQGHADIQALDGICPHAGGPLGQGALHGTTLVCPWHAWEYDVRSGANEMDVGLRLAKFAVQIQGDDILVDIP